MAKTKEDALAAKAANAESEEAPVKRGRGRPKGTGYGGVEKKGPTGRPRGRPPKDPAAGPKPPREPTGRPRGRPPGAAKKTKAPAATPTKGISKGTRGRPRKSDVAAEVDGDVKKTPASAGKKRGRKPAQPVSVEEEQDDEEGLEDKDEDEEPARLDEVEEDADPEITGDPGTGRDTGDGSKTGISSPWSGGLHRLKSMFG